MKVQSLMVMTASKAVDDFFPSIETRYKNCVNKLYDILGLRNSGILEYLLNNGCVIAGGSIVYATVKDVPAESVGDIDVFITNSGNFEDIRNYISQTFCGDIHWINTSNGYSENGSVLDCNIKGSRRNLQFIYSKGVDLEQIVDSFDMDYVQCGINSERIYKSELCKISHKHKKVFKVTFPFFSPRCLKAMRKGFIVGIPPTHYKRRRCVGIDGNSGNVTTRVSFDPPPIKSTSEISDLYRVLPLHEDYLHKMCYMSHGYTVYSIVEKNHKYEEYNSHLRSWKGSAEIPIRYNNIFSGTPKIDVPEIDVSEIDVSETIRNLRFGDKHYNIELKCFKGPDQTLKMVIIEI